MEEENLAWTMNTKSMTANMNTKLLLIGTCTPNSCMDNHTIIDRNWLWARKKHWVELNNKVGNDGVHRTDIERTYLGLRVVESLHVLLEWTATVDWCMRDMQWYKDCLLFTVQEINTGHGFSIVGGIDLFLMNTKYLNFYFFLMNVRRFYPILSLR